MLNFLAPDFFTCAFVLLPREVVPNCVKVLLFLVVQVAHTIAPDISTPSFLDGCPSYGVQSVSLGALSARLAIWSICAVAGINSRASASRAHPLFQRFQHLWCGGDQAGIG